MQKIHADKVLIVDDEPYIREILGRWLGMEGYPCETAASAEEALETLKDNGFTLVVSDINMPGMTGIELLATIKKELKDVAVIMATAVDDRKTAIRTLELGAYGYIIKPFERNEVVINAANALRLRALEIENRIHSEGLEKMVLVRTKELRDAVIRLTAAEKEVRLSRQETILRLAKAAEFRDNETARHTIRMGEYCFLLARKAGFDAAYCELLRMASPLHDVGKIGTPDRVLLKPGPLTAKEFEIMKRHAEIGYRILAHSGSELLALGAIIAWTHHEKFDGSGYPRGLAGEEIPVEGRIVAVCDVFDALTSNRVYKAAFSIDKALEIMREGRGKHFDPNLLDHFLEAMDQILAIKEKNPDDAPSQLHLQAGSEFWHPDTSKD